MDLAQGLRDAKGGSIGDEIHSFDFEVEPLYTQRESEFLARHLQEHGSMPRGNDILSELLDDDDEDGLPQEMKTDLRERLLAEGWEERFSAAGGRLEEAAEFYRSLGFEVRIEDVAESASADACTSCFGVAGAEGPVGMIFTRGEGGSPPLEDDL